MCSVFQVKLCSLKEEKENSISRVTLNYDTLSSKPFPFNVVRTRGKI